MSLSSFQWKWCNQCRCAAFICPKCGNNCCNGGSGDNCPDNCQEAYDYQEQAYKDGKVPSKEECEGVIPSIDGIL
jgi:hypothetical protein